MRILCFWKSAAKAPGQIVKSLICVSRSGAIAAFVFAAAAMLFVSPALAIVRSTITVTSSGNPSTSGSVVFTVTVKTSPGVGTPTGTVILRDGVEELNSYNVPLQISNGQATLSVQSLSVGQHTITAQYSGDTNYSNGFSPVFVQTVNGTKTTTITALQSSLNPAAPGQSVKFAATVTSTSGTPTGNVTFKDGTTSLSGPLPLSGNTAAYSTSTLASGPHSITAVYSGDSNFAGSTSAALTQTVLNTTSTVLSSKPNPSAPGQLVTITATINANSGTPTGTITFNDGATPLSSPVPLSAGSATYKTSSLALGKHSITAVYSGDSNFATSTSAALTQTVSQTKITPNTTVTSKPNPSQPGQLIEFAATVTPPAGSSEAPTGDVSFYNGSVFLGSAPLTNGQAFFYIPLAARGTYYITADYGGDSNFSSSTSAQLKQTVSEGTITTLTSKPNPSQPGAVVTFTATVAPSPGSTGTPSGDVSFYNGSTFLASVPLASGEASYYTPFATAGTYPITASYAGDNNFGGSKSGVLTQTVYQTTTTTTTLKSSTNPSPFGTAVQFTATVNTSSGTPTGTVTFFDGLTPLSGAVALSGNTAIYSTSGLALGTHSITAVYSGDSNFATSTSGMLQQTVDPVSGKVTPTVILTVNPSSAQVGDKITFTATVQQTPGYPVPTGSITISSSTNSSERYGVATLNPQGVGVVQNSTLQAGTYTVVATYGGDNAQKYYNGAQSNTVSFTVK
jgi:hypothetical protein